MLVASFCAASPKALDFDIVYAENADYVYSLLRRLSREEQPDDLFQDVFMVVCRRLPSFRGEAAIRTWLFQICYRVVGAHWRKQRLSRRLRELVSRSALQPPDWAGNCPREHRREVLEAALRRLPWEQQAVVVLHQLADWSCAEIAEKLELPVNTVYSRLHRARSSLRLSIDSEVGR